MVNLRLLQTWIQTENTFTGKFCNPAQYPCNPIWAVPISVPCETHQTWNLKGIDVLHLKENRPCSMVNVKRWTKGKRMHLMGIRYTEWYSIIRNGMPWLFLEFDGILLWPLFSTCLEKLSHWVGKAAVYTITRQPVVGQPNPTNLISFLIKQHLQFTGWSAKEFFRGILIYLPPKCGRTPKSVTSSSKHSFWPTNGCGRWLVPVKQPKHSHCCFSGLQKCEWSWVGEVNC